jgi:hypothetical protein
VNLAVLLVSNHSLASRDQLIVGVIFLDESNGLGTVKAQSLESRIPGNHFGINLIAAIGALIVGKRHSDGSLDLGPANLARKLECSFH